MPEPSQFMFTYHELIAAMVKQAGIHEGKWQLIMNFGLGAGNMGPTEAELVPGAMVAVTSIGIQKATDGAPAALVVDASIVNPAST
ncbi:hypothetical protein RX327_33705 [Bradyrhizobium sp. BEA-2-5]|uniref:hypothetical protein n=1 Tax=Bradyrhizobium sp. BEA-2-5 TaxID=3080015 RepID=UPI00293E94E9|nr:hypothetical protein [Bradyrhizobium sp. BEA-2-5]WOH80658.1 hypothetical protein RX327_33705 [Bradyrhizobium sp. BEA-2-5]